MFKKALLLISLVMISVTLSANFVHAEDKADVLKILEQFKKENSANTIRLTSNKNHLIRLDKDAASVIVNNPNHASVMLDTPRLLIIVPHEPGATSFTVLGANGETIMEKNLIITNVQPKYVRIRRMCGDDRNCQPSSYFYCPDGCYEVTSLPNENNTNNNPAPLRSTEYGNYTSNGEQSITEGQE